MTAAMTKNRLYFGDNLEVLREHVGSESVDLVYLDPPFNSKRGYNLLFKTPKGLGSGSQITAFEDTWHWGEQAEREYADLLKQPNTAVSAMVRAFRDFLGVNDMMAYLTMMAGRLLELRRVLKPTGSLYLHCDPTASHYLKILLDGVFGKENYRNEIIWQRTNIHSDSMTWSKVSDTILFYSKGSKIVWNPIHLPHSEEHITAKYTNTDPGGRRYTLSDMTSPNPRPNMMYEWKGFQSPKMGWRYSKETMQKLDAEERIYYPDDSSKRPRLKRYLDEMPGTLLGNIWTDISPINSQAAERLGYPTQKPLALLERIVRASSNEGDAVLDPFCGCGTAVHAAQKLGREWAGIDVTHLAISLVEKRMKDAFPGIPFEVVGLPQDADAARNLAERDKYQFQWWACSLVGAQPYQGKKKGADGGVDGVLYFRDLAPAKGAGGVAETQAGFGETRDHKVVVSVKGGEHVTAHMVRDMAGVVEREKAAMGIFVTLAEPTKPMRVEAAAAGLYLSPTGRSYQKIQVLTVAGLLEGRERPEYPDVSRGGITFKRAKVEAAPVKAKELF